MNKKLALVLTLIASTVLAETWTRSSGKTFEAELIHAGSGIVHFKKADGSAMAMPISKLSDADQARINKTTQTQDGATDTAPSAAQGATVTDEIKKMFGDELYTKDKTKHGIDKLAGKDVIGIYFSAHWCPPCRKFTPKLVDFANQMEKDGKSFEIVFVSSDRSNDAMFKYMTEMKMPWVAMPHKAAKATALSKKYGVRGIPTLIIIDKDGKTLSTNGRGDVSRNGATAYEEWAK